MTHRPPRALLLDLDGTLLDWSGRHPAAERACAATADRFPPLDAATLLAVYDACGRRYRSEVEQDCWTGRLDGVPVEREVWRRTLRGCGCDALDEEEAAAFASETHARLSREAYRLFPDATELLAAAAAAGLRTALVTNGPSDIQRDKLAALGLEAALDAVLVSGEVGVAKPDGALFLMALDALGVGPRDAWHVGDSLATDVGGARAAGIPVVWLNRSGRERRPDAEVPDLEVGSLLELVPLLVSAAPRAPGTACG